MADASQAPLYTFRPPQAHPIIHAGILLFGVVFVTGSLENLMRDDRTVLYLLYALPLLGAIALYVALRPSSVRIHEHGIAPSRPLIMRWHRPFVRWDELAAVYPSYYDVTGAFVSPFASSDGKVTQLGLGLEWPDGRSETVRFTPDHFVMGQKESPGYLDAIGVVRNLFAARGRPLVPDAERFDDAQVKAMTAEASKPFMPFFAIVFLVASAAPTLWILLRLHVPIPLALPLSFAPPVGVSLRSYVQSRRRNRILNRLAKAAEHARASGGTS